MLSINGIHKRFGAVHALNNVSLDLKPGLFGLLGPNGAGKSTLMRTLATLQTPDEGTITYNGKDITKDPDVIRATLGYLPQDFGVYPRMSALKLLDHIAVLKGISNKAERKEQVESLLKMVNLWTHKTASVATYSGGMRQRFGVAQALLGDPSLIIVDEPTAGLDPLERQRFLDILSRAGDDKIIILSTHIIEDVRDLCTDMGVMGDGRLIVRGAPEDLIDQIQNQVWTKSFESDDDVDRVKTETQVLSTRRLRGATVVSALSSNAPGAGWESRDVLLEDAYFAYLNGFMSEGQRVAEFA
jgi:ABC-type multidrug transport system ATPase subunit